MNKCDMTAMEQGPNEEQDPGATKHVNQHEKKGMKRLDECVSQKEHPYCFRVGNNEVRVSFAENGASLESKLEAFFIARKDTL